MSEGLQDGLEHIPKERHHRPLHLIKHMRETEEQLAYHLTEYTRRTNSEVESKDGQDWYKVFLGSEEENTMPFCD